MNPTNCTIVRSRVAVPAQFVPRDARAICAQSRWRQIGGAPLLALGLVVALLPSSIEAQEQIYQTPNLPQSIFGGAPVTDIWGVVNVTSLTGLTCSGTIVSKSWVLLAAHCFAAAEDPNGDGIISATEGASAVTVSGPSSAFTGTFNAIKVRKHPEAVWGQAVARDAALVNVNGVFRMDRLSPLFYDYSTTLTGPFLKISRRPTDDLDGSSVLTMGFAGGTLRSASTNIPNEQAFVGWFRTAAGHGASCRGDSGGPSWTRTQGPLQPLGWYQIGIHSAGGFNCDGMTMSTDLGTAEIRDWIIGTAWLQ